MNRSINSFRKLMGAGALVLCLAVGLQAQDPYYGPRNDPYYGHNRYGQDRYTAQRGYGYERSQEALIGRVLSDLNRAAASAYLDGHERKHFEEAAGKLQDFQERWARGKFDTGKLDRAIDNIEHLAGADRVRGRERDMLARDVQDLRQFRATRGRYYPSGDNYPYRR